MVGTPRRIRYILDLNETILNLRTHHININHIQYCTNSRNVTYRISAKQIWVTNPGFRSSIPHATVSDAARSFSVRKIPSWRESNVWEELMM